MAEEMLQQCDLQKSDLNAVAFGSGPGSFNGIRVAASFAHGVAMAQNINIVPCSTLHALAMTPNFTTSRNVLVISDARQNEVYWSCVRLSAEGQIAEIVIDNKVTSPSAVSVPKGAKWCVVPSRWTQYEEFLPPCITTLPRITCDYPSALPIAKFARYSLQCQKRFSPAEAMPVYLRSPIKQGH